MAFPVSIKLLSYPEEARATNDVARAIFASATDNLPINTA